MLVSVASAVGRREVARSIQGFVTRLVTRTGFLGHTLQYGQMRFHFRSWRGFPTGCNVMLDESDEKP
jgi:hypothetical protein